MNEQAPSKDQLPQAMPSTESTVAQLEIVSAIHHHAAEIARLTETWPTREFKYAVEEFSERAEAWHKVFDAMRRRNPAFCTNSKAGIDAVLSELDRLYTVHEPPEEPSVMGGMLSQPRPPVPSGEKLIEWCVQQIQITCDALNLDPAQWLNDSTAQDDSSSQPPADDAARLNWWFMNVLHVGGDEDDDEAGSEIEYEARLCRTPNEFRAMIDAAMGSASTKGDKP